MKKIVFLFVVLSPVCAQEIGIKSEKIHKVTHGDTLWGIAIKYYGDGFKWGQIYNRNLEIIKNPDLIFPDMEIKLPEIEEFILPKLPGEKKNENTDMILSSQAISTSLQIIHSSFPPKDVEGFTNNKKIELAMLGIKKDNEPELLDGLTLNDDMPLSQITSPIFAKTIKVDEDFFDGKVISKEGEDDIENEGLAQEGDIIRVELNNKGFKNQDRLILYKKGIYLDNKITAQYAGIAKIIELKDNIANCKILRVNTAIDEEVFVKKIEK